MKIQPDLQYMTWISIIYITILLALLSNVSIPDDYNYTVLPNLILLISMFLLDTRLVLHLTHKTIMQKQNYFNPALQLLLLHQKYSSTQLGYPVIASFTWISLQSHLSCCTIKTFTLYYLKPMNLIGYHNTTNQHSTNHSFNNIWLFMIFVITTPAKTSHTCHKPQTILTINDTIHTMPPRRNVNYFLYPTLPGLDTEINQNQRNFEKNLGIPM